MADTSVPVQTKAPPPASSQWPWESWRPLREEVNRLFDRFAAGVGFPSSKRSPEGLPMTGFGAAFSLAAPAVDLTEDAAGFRITAELPGMTEKDIEVGLSGDLLTIKGEKRHEREDKSENYHLSERVYGSFQRTFYLPDGVDRDKIAAEFTKGVLTLTLPKTAEAQQATKKIEVKAS